MSVDTGKNTHTAAIAESFFIANMLFVGLFYIAIWVLFILRYNTSSSVTKNHLKQTLIASSLSTALFIAINAFILLTIGYGTASALLILEVYFMLIVPLFAFVGIMGFSKAVNGKDFKFPLIASVSGISHWQL